MTLQRNQIHSYTDGEPSLADILEQGAGDDIYYDASEYGEHEKQKTIDRFRQAAFVAARLLRKFMKGCDPDEIMDIEIRNEARREYLEWGFVDADIPVIY